jgi:deoxyribonuclease V
MRDIPNDWLYPGSLENAARIQRLLAEQVRVEDGFDAVNTIGGTDVSNNIYDPEQRVYAAVVTLTSQDLTVQAQSCVMEKAPLPYVPGFLGFREAPALVRAYQQLQTVPDVLLVDGHGISHPRGLGIASHLGVLLDRPTVGVAKSILVGNPADTLGNQPGDRVPLIWRGQVLGMVVRTKRNVQPVYVSVGHRICLEKAVELVLASVSRYRLPEPTRQAHLAANTCRKAMMSLPMTEVLSHPVGSEI